MATWTFTNSNTYITVTRDSISFRVSKYAPISMTVSGTVLTFSYSDTISQSNRKTNSRTFEIEHSDVTTPVTANATALKNTIQGWLDVIGGSSPATHASSHQNGGLDEISVAGLSGLLADPQTVEVVKNSGAVVSTRKQLNFIEGSNVTLTIADDAGNSQADITIAASSGLSDGDKGDLTVSSSGTVMTIDPDVVRNDNSLRAYTLLGSTILAQPVGMTFSQMASNLTITAQRAQFVAVWLPYAATITGAKWYQNTQGDYTANNNNEINLYTYSGGTLTYVAGTGNVANLWKAASGTLASQAFSGTYSAAAGLYFIGYIWNRSAVVTAPIIGGTGTQSNAPAMDFTNSAKLWALLNSQTGLSSTTQSMAALSVSQFSGWMGLY